MKSSHVIGLSMVLLAATATASVADPSFDCGRAATADEQAICGSTELSKLDSLVASAFASYQPDFQPRGKVARGLLRERQGCGEDTACIAASQLNALQTYGGDAQWAVDMVNKMIAGNAEAAADQERFSSRLPQKPAECVKTRIKEITTRLGEPLAGSSPDAGAYVSYDNGGYISSYDRGENFEGIAPGQPAVMCLMSVPHDCPAGDARGRIYYTLDIATGRSWISSDSEHNCGGA